MVSAMMMRTAMIEASVRIPSDYRVPVRLSWEDHGGSHISSRLSGSVNLERSKSRGATRGMRALQLKNKIRASMESADSESSMVNSSFRYHPSEEIEVSALGSCGDAKLTAQETARTLVEVNKKATLMLTGLISDEIHENIIWPDIPYVTDDHGNIYFQVKNEEDIMQTLTSDTNIVHAIIGFDAMEMIGEMELIDSTEIEFGIDEIEDEDNDIEDDSDDDSNEDDDDYDEEYITVLGEDEEDSDESIGDWAKLETMRSSHPMHFAKKMAQAATDDPVDWMAQPPSGLAVQGLIRPALSEERSDIQRRMTSISSSVSDAVTGEETSDGTLDDYTVANGQDHHHVASSQDDPSWPKELDLEIPPPNGVSFYKLEMTKIQLISAHGAHVAFDVEDFRNAQPDPVALSAAKIIARVKSGGENVADALKSLCWRCKGVHVEEAALIGVDSLGFDLRVSSGRQIQSLRFAFTSRATSERSADRQLDDFLFPKMPPVQHKMKQTRQK